MFTSKKKEGSRKSSPVAYPGTIPNQSPSQSAYYGPNTTIIEPPLPQGWEGRIDARGRKYYVDHNSKSTSWFHPLLPQPMLPQISQPNSQLPSASNSNNNSSSDLSSSMVNKLSFADTILAEFEDEKKQNAATVDEMKKKMEGNSFSPDLIEQWESLIEKSESRKVKLIELKMINEKLEAKLQKKAKNEELLNEKISQLERKVSHIKGIGLDQLDLKDLQTFIKDIENTSAIARQREIYLKDKMNNATSNECKICFEAETDCVILECGHQCCCTECGKSLKICPICRKPITRIIPIYKA